MKSSNSLIKTVNQRVLHFSDIPAVTPAPGPRNVLNLSGISEKQGEPGYKPLRNRLKNPVKQA